MEEHDKQMLTDMISDSSSDSSDSEAAGENLEQLKNSLAESGTYDAYASYWRALRSAGELDELRRVREAMSEKYPVEPALFLEWCEDEGRLASSIDEKNAVLAIYRRGLDTYLSVPLWLSYLDYMRDSEQSSEEIRNAFKSAVSAFGSHVSEGHTLWSKYTEFELGQTGTGQRERLQKLYLDRASRVIENNEAVIRDATALGGASGCPPDISSAYDAAQKEVIARRPHEQSISFAIESGDQQKLHNSFKAYAAYEIETCGSNLSDALVTVYERWISHCFLNSESWLSYMECLLHLKQYDRAGQVAARAVRNIMADGRLWALYLVSESRRSGTLDEIVKRVDSVHEGLLAVTFYSADALLEPLLAYCDFVRRHTEKVMANGNEETTKPTRAWCSDRLNASKRRMVEAFPEAEETLMLMTYEADVTARVLGSVGPARKMWQEVTKKWGTLSTTWLEYVTFERMYGQVSSCRAAFKQALRNTKYWPEAIAKEWVRFEHLHGSLEEVEFARKKCEERMEQVNKIRLREQEKQQRMEEKRQKQELQAEAPQRKGGKRSRDHPEASTSAKRARHAEPISVRESSESTSAHADVDVPMKDAAEEHNVLEPATEDASPASTSTKQEKKPSQKKFTYGSDDDACKVFVKNLKFQMNEDAIEELFAPCGSIKTLRLVREQPSGRSKGYAYVEFATEEAAQKAIAMDGTDVQGRRLMVEKAGIRPKPSKAEESKPKSDKPVTFLLPAAVQRRNVPTKRRARLERRHVPGSEAAPGVTGSKYAGGSTDPFRHAALAATKDSSEKAEKETSVEVPETPGKISSAANPTTDSSEHKVSQGKGLNQNDFRQMLLKGK
eukprot:Rmarinus@m.26089